MAGVNHDPSIDFAKRITDIERALSDLQTRDVLQNASIGANGLLIFGGGSITVQDGGSIVVTGTGTISLPTGTLSAGALLISGSATISGVLSTGGVSSGGTGSFGSVTAATGDVTAAGNVTAGNNVTASGQVVSAGVIVSPGTKAFTVTVGYSAVYVDASGNFGGNTSSRRFKTNISPAVYDLDALLAIPAFSYQRHEDVLQFGAEAAPWFDGMMAEDVEPILPLHVWHDEDGLVQGIRFEELVTPLIQAVARERHERLTMQAAFEARIAALEAR